MIEQPAPHYSHCCRDDLMSPLGIASPVAGPSSPRAQWPQMRGTTADAAANALAKGSPRGVAHSNATAAADAVAAAVVAADGPAIEEAMKKLQRLSVVAPGVHGLGNAPGAPTLNQGGCCGCRVCAVRRVRLWCASYLLKWKCCHACQTGSGSSLDASLACTALTVPRVPPVLQVCCVWTLWASSCLPRHSRTAA